MLTPESDWITEGIHPVVRGRLEVIESASFVP
jgi:hypothetical protein